MPVTVWEPERDYTFAEIIERTPERLRELGLYAPLAIEWRSGALLAASLQLLARALGARELHPSGCMTPCECGARGLARWLRGRRGEAGGGSGLLRSRGGLVIELSERAVPPSGRVGREAGGVGSALGADVQLSMALSAKEASSGLHSHVRARVGPSEP